MAQEMLEGVVSSAEQELHANKGIPLVIQQRTETKLTANLRREHQPSAVEQWSHPAQPFPGSWENSSSVPQPGELRDGG